MSYLIIQWPNGERKILDCIPHTETPSYINLQKYSQVLGVRVDWVQSDQKDWLREHGFIT